MVEVDEQGPMDEPRPRVQLSQRGLGDGDGDVGAGSQGGEEGGGLAGVDGVAQGVEFFECDLPFSGEDVAGEFAPVGGGVEIGVSGENAEVVEIVSGAAVVPVRVLELAKVVKSGYLFKGELECEKDEGEEREKMMRRRWQ